MKNKILWLGVLFFLIPTTSAFSFDAVTPEEANELATTDANTFILDVRTIAEWKWVGHPGENELGEGAALQGKVINISSRIEKKGQMVINRSFLRDIDSVFDDNPDVTLITMCRSGGRGAAAAQILEDNGYNVFNMVEAFQGAADERGYRTLNGWVVSGLPYTYTGPGYQK